MTWSKDTASSLRLACKPENWLSAAHFTTTEVHCKNPMEDQKRQTGLCSERKIFEEHTGQPLFNKKLSRPKIQFAHAKSVAEDPRNQSTKP